MGRAVTEEEGRKLAEELDCDFFSEISVKTNIEEPSEVYFELWRSFSLKCPHSPSSGHRRRASNKLQDRIPSMISRLSISVPHHTPYRERSPSPKLLRTLKRQLSRSFSIDEKSPPRLVHQITAPDNRRNTLQLPQISVSPAEIPSPSQGRRSLNVPALRKQSSLTTTISKYITLSPNERQQFFNLNKCKRLSVEQIRSLSQ